MNRGWCPRGMWWLFGLIWADVNAPRMAALRENGVIWWRVQEGTMWKIEAVGAVFTEGVIGGFDIGLTREGVPVEADVPALKAFNAGNGDDPGEGGRRGDRVAEG